MTILSRKSEVQPIIDECLSIYDQEGVKKCIVQLHDTLLTLKVKFPLLEHCGFEFYRRTTSSDHIKICNEIEQLKTEGGNVLLGTILQRRLSDHFQESFSKATEYISRADDWRICDIIGERVFGMSILKQPEQTIPEISRLFQHKTNWVIRSLGAGIHYAIKKGLSEKYVKSLFVLLLSHANHTDHEVRQGIGWAAKTTAKFHPSIIAEFNEQIHHTEKVGNWFRSRLELGLDRFHYAKRN